MASSAEVPVSRNGHRQLAETGALTTPTSARMVAVSLSDKLIAGAAHAPIDKVTLSALPNIKPRAKNEEQKMVWDAAVDVALEKLGDEDFFTSPPPSADDHGGIS